MRLLTSSPARRVDSLSKRSASSGERPIVFPSRIPETDSDSCTSEEMSAIDSWRVIEISRRAAPTFRVIRTKIGISPSATIASSHWIRNIAITVAITVVTVDITEVAVEVSTLSTPPMSFAIRLCTSPVRVFVKNASDIRCRCR